MCAESAKRIQREIPADDVNALFLELRRLALRALATGDRMTDTLEEFDRILALLAKAGYEIPLTEAGLLADAYMGQSEVQDRNVLASAGERGALVLEVKHGDVEDLHVRIDRGEWFHLPYKVAKIFRILVRDYLDCDCRGDSESSWHSYSEIAMEMGRPQLSRQAKGQINNLLHRLRGILLEQSANKLYLQTDPVLGVRFRLHREAEVVIEDKRL